MAAHANFHKPSDNLFFTVDVSTQNHPAFTNTCAHIEKHHLTPAQVLEVKNLREAGLKPSKVLKVMNTTKQEGKSLIATKNTIYVAKKQNQLGNSDYSNYVKTENDETLKALFFCNHSYLKL
ncbi:uncharacterized protein VP01_675g10 [Puccinia sorghi]|uniref:Uncharacterized protein n=1 Tax=Puccinia sorghi TaxID=27349 RepID=A0A0L6UFI0_9BASI|nr:uncharacterized protein VP01_675g10 [Puccinia sorghi]